MQNYKNLSGKSTVKGYKASKDYITVEFTTPSHSNCTFYKYTTASAGAENIEKMKQMAEAGQGLGTFITEHVRKAYDSKW